MARQFDPRTTDIYDKLGKVHSDKPKPAKKIKARYLSSKSDTLDDQFKNIIKLDMRATVSTFAQSNITSPRQFEKLPDVSSTKFKSHTSSLSPPRLPPAYRVTATHKRSLMLDMIDSGGFAEKPRKHVRSPVRFDRQAGRGELKLSDYDASENRFVSINHSPSNSTKVRRATAPNLEKYLGRVDTTKKDNLPSYDAKYDFVYKGVRQSPGFEKRVGRDDIFTVPLNDLCYDGKYQLVSPRILSPRLDKNLSRPEDKILPAFMLVLYI